MSVLLLSCGGGGKETGNATETETITSSAELIKKGEQLVNASDCKTCHHQVNKIIGPSHLDVAKKYEFTQENVKLMAERIIKGGSGVWGDVPMTPHPDLSVTDAENMARYVLSLDGEAEKK
ncbi:MAG: cytochrome C552 [Flammeovirgaceae bacterium]|nr:MAG: cytochrome C552 [Flammeovirgaceae bacterium]